MKIQFKLDFPGSHGYVDIKVKWPLKVLPRINEQIEIADFMDEGNDRQLASQLDWKVIAVRYKMVEYKFVPVITIEGTN